MSGAGVVVVTLECASCGGRAGWALSRHWNEQEKKEKRTTLAVVDGVDGVVGVVGCCDEC